jgi:hypothetical protein
MTYISLGLAVIIIIILSSYLFFLRRALSNTIKQMDDIEKHPERNRQLKAITIDYLVEKLLEKINYIYNARQQERIIYQRSETKIRKEIENISHDLRTPLTSILGYLELIEDSESLEEKNEYLDIIRKRARILQCFIQDFYEISRIEGNDYPLILELVTVQEILKDTIVLYYYELEKKLAVEIDLEEKPTNIIVDRIQFNRILNNLVQNALKYANEKFIIKQFVSNDICILQFMNDKNQMTEEELKVIFDRFYTGDQTRSNQSTGLGLTITKILVEKMKGTIEAKFVDNLFVIELCWPWK